MRIVFRIAVTGLAAAAAIPSAWAQTDNRKTKALNRAAINRLMSETGGRARVSLHPATGAARFVRVEPGAIVAARPQGPVTAAVARDEAAGFLRRHAGIFGIRDVAAELQMVGEKTDRQGNRHFTYQQMYKGVPVFAGVLKSHLDADNQLRAVNGTFVPGLDLNVAPTRKQEDAGRVALAKVGADKPEASGVKVRGTRLFVFREGLVKGVPGPNRLAWEVEVGNGRDVREFVFVDAHTGKWIDQFTGIQDAMFRRAYDGRYLNGVPPEYPATPFWVEGDLFPTTGTCVQGAGQPNCNAEANNMITSSQETYDMYFNAFGRDSFDAAGGIMDSIFDRGYQCPNASWNGTFISFCPGLTTDDVTGHEWSHAYTQYTDGLIYAWQPGALNEAASDIFGETLDRINNRGGDTPNTTRNAGACTTFTALPPVVTINSPAAIAGNKPAGTAAFGPQTFTITNDVVLVNDGVAPTGDGCETPFSNAAALNGKFALVDRGLCGFAVKVKNAQLNGAIGVIVANNQPGIVNMGGVDPTITIPSLSVLQTDGAAIKAQLGLGQTVNATLTRATGTDNSVRWLLGEDDTAPGLTGALRDMWNPTCYGNPGKVSDADYGCSAGDQGGVHDNSGVDNHAYSLLVDGGSYNGQTITGIGLTKAAHIWFWAKTHYQGPATDFAEHADALEQSCSDLTDVNLDDLNTGAPSGQIISAADCAELHEVTLAVEFRNPPTQCNFQPLLAKNPPDRCEAGTTQVNVFADTFAKDPFRPNRWTASRENTTVDFTDRDWTWSHDLPDRAGSALFAPDPSIGTCAPGGDESGVLVVTSPPITLPAGAAAPRLTFDHWVSTEAAFDGGNLRISVNGGPWMLVAQADFTFNGYNATLATTAQGNTNPLQGQRAFSGSDGGSVLGSWGRSHVNLAAYATALDTIQLRWDFGTDGCGGVFGWYVDDVTVHACTSNIKPDITINDITVTEGSFTSLFNLFTPATFTVSLSHAYAKPVSVKFVTKPGTAKAILDYIPIAGKATIDPLDLTEDVTTWVIADHKEEPNETFFLDLFNPVNGNLLDNRGMCTIANDDF